MLFLQHYHWCPTWVHWAGKLLTRVGLPLIAGKSINGDPSCENPSPLYFYFWLFPELLGAPGGYSSPCDCFICSCSLFTLITSHPLVNLLSGRWTQGQAWMSAGSGLSILGQEILGSWDPELDLEVGLWLSVDMFPCLYGLLVSCGGQKWRKFRAGPSKL